MESCYLVSSDAHMDSHTKDRGQNKVKEGIPVKRKAADWKYNHVPTANHDTRLYSVNE